MMPGMCQIRMLKTSPRSDILEVPFSEAFAHSVGKNVLAGRLFSSGKIFWSVIFQKISTFLLMWLQGLLGKVFYPVESDISGNVKKLRTFLEQHTDKVNYVNDIVVLATSVNDGVAIDALLWLKRALEFTMIFMEGIVTATRDGNISEDLNPSCTAAYEKTLKKYHGWIAQQAFGLVSRFCPYRKVLIETLALNKQDMEEIVIDQMETVLVNLKKDLDIINLLYTEYNLNSDALV